MGKIAGLTNAMTDVIVMVSDEEVARLGLKMGYDNSKKDVRYDDVMAALEGKEKKCMPGGSPANMIRDCAALGMQTALLGTVGTDSIGDGYVADCQDKGIEALLSREEGPSGICYIMVSPRGEKTSLAQVGVCGRYSYDLSMCKDVDIFHTSGYELRTNTERALETIKSMKRNGAKISYDLADPLMVRKRKHEVTRLLGQLDFLFMTEKEAEELTDLPQYDALYELGRQVPYVVLKRGEKGSVVAHERRMYGIGAFPAKVVNTNGAGDAYAAGFLTSYLQGWDAESCGWRGSLVAASVCERVEAYLGVMDLDGARDDGERNWP